MKLLISITLATFLVGCVTTKPKPQPVVSDKTYWGGYVDGYIKGYEAGEANYKF